MSEIEKMYENAGVKKEVIPCPAKYYGYDCTRNNWDDADCSCDIEGYPPFTAEKQIELIKILSTNYVDKPNKTLWIDKDEIANEWYISVHYSDHYGYNNHANNFEEALAGLTNQLWQDLTEEEQQQVRGILK